MRNAKVRRRIAAGKLKLRIRDLRNLGPRSEELLARIGIRSADGLRRRGAVEAYLALRRVGATRSLNMLWAMAGALDPWPEGQDWRDVAAGDQRLPLLLAVDDPTAAQTVASSTRRRSPFAARSRRRERTRPHPPAPVRAGRIREGVECPALSHTNGDSFRSARRGRASARSSGAARARP